MVEVWGPDARHHADITVMRSLPPDENSKDVCILRYITIRKLLLCIEAQRFFQKQN